ncbi:MAG TPA: S1C family serine protease [Longimicrobium sp.]|nr:S1C family serine protease [Longimicrobium sp.]
MELAGERVSAAVAALVERLRPSIVRLHAHCGQGGGGTGIVWRQDGLVLTNAHVCKAPAHGVELADGRVVEGRVMWSDASRDLAAVQVEAGPLPPAPRAPSATLRPGEIVIAVGNPFGWPGTVTLGVVHMLERSRPGGSPRWIRGNIRIVPGNSGGPLLDAAGRVVGINSAVVYRVASALPMEFVERFVEARGRRMPPGVALRAVPLREGVQGWMATAVQPWGLLAAAGVLPGDVLLRAEGRAIESEADLTNTLDEAGAEGSVRLEMMRGGAPLVLDVPVPRAPENPPPPGAGR